jgi:hypothetical protein
MTHFVENMAKAERKRIRNNFLASLRSKNGNTFVFSSYNVIFAVEPCTSSTGCNMFKVSTAYCNETDKFKKSVGELIALYRLFGGEYAIIKNTSGMDSLVSSLLDQMEMDY